MKVKLFIGLATRVEDERVLNLFRFPLEDAFLPGARWSAKWWSHGRTKRMQSKDRERILFRLSRDGFNELEIACKTGPTKPARNAMFTEVWTTTLLFSPMNLLWAPVPEEKPKNIADDRKRFNFAMRARGVVTGMYDATFPSPEQKPRPTEIDCTLGVEIAADTDQMKLQRLCIDLIRSAIPASLRDCDIFGYGCIGGGCRNMGMIIGAGARGANVDELGEKFENIYPILIGSKESCEGLAGVLGGIEKWPLFEGANSPTCILSVPPDLVVTPSPRKPDVLAPCASDPAVRRWLV